jgi:hypothetical protein
LWEKTRLRAAFPDSETNQFLWVDGPSAKNRRQVIPARGKEAKGLKQGSFLTAVAKQTTVQANHCQHVFALFNRLSTVYWIKNRRCVAVSSTVSGSAAVVSKNHARGLGLRVINPAVRMRHNETKPPDPTVRPPLFGSRWCMAMVG